MNPLTKFFPLLSNSTVGILGYGVEGKSTYHALKKWGMDKVLVFDSNLPEGVASDYRGNLSANDAMLECDVLFRSPGIRPDVPGIVEWKSYKESKLTYGGVLSQTQVFLDTYPREKIIAVTGTLGKGSFCAMLKHVFDKLGIPAVIAGNFGVPFFDLEYYQSPSNSKNCPYIIAELSSFQLSDTHTSPFRTVILRTTSEHLDWHKDVLEYRMHKANLVKFQSQDDFIFFLSGCEGSEQIAQTSPAQAFPFGEKGRVILRQEGLIIRDLDLSKKIQSISIHQTQMAGLFQLENMAAVTSVCLNMEQNPFDILEHLKTYSGLPHRLEYIGTANEIRFFNDSYATRPDATVGAIHSFAHESLGVILGGSEKFADFSAMIETIFKREQFTKLALIGQTSQRLYEEMLPWLEKLPAHKFAYFEISLKETLEDSLTYLQEKNSEGNKVKTILLSPACASFGLFPNYKVRGERFKALVNQIIEKNHP